MTAILEPIPTDTDPATGITRTPRAAYPDDSMFGPAAPSPEPLPASATDDAYITAAEEQVKREVYLARAACLVDTAGWWAGEARFLSAAVEWEGTRGLAAQLLEDVTRLLLPDYEDSSIEQDILEDR